MDQVAHVFEVAARFGQGDNVVREAAIRKR